MSKNLKIFAICALAVLSCFSCQSSKEQAEQRPSNFEGPAWDDDYSAITNIENYREWGAFNVHDPSVIKSGDYYYAYSTDAIWWPEGAVRESDTIDIGNIQIRRSEDLVNWEFFGWALDSIPAAAAAHIEEASGGKNSGGIWAPYIQKHNDSYRLYYSVSVFGANTSTIGLATSNSPEGPWEHKGLVVKTFKEDPVNAIDPSIVVDVKTGQYWMTYGSYFGGMYILELDPETGLAKTEGDLGKMIARRGEQQTKIIEAPEVIYNPDLEKYFLFVSYDALFTHYNVRVGRSDSPEGPYLDMFGNNMADTTNNFPVLTYAYKFEGHPGWAGVGHCAVLNDNGKFFMFHQGRLAPENLMMVLHVREIFWTEDGWPVVSPERFAGVPNTQVSEDELLGEWEFIHLAEVNDTVTLWQGQIPPGGWHYSDAMFNNSIKIQLKEGGKIEGISKYDSWEMKDSKFYLFSVGDSEKIEVIATHGWDWENDREALLFTGIAKDGFSIWGKKSTKKENEPRARIE